MEEFFLFFEKNAQPYRFAVGKYGKANAFIA